jgi:pantetheine-phosphate adenylyltransferase
VATALCPGSFDPVTLGHVDIIERTARHFDEVIIAVSRNLQKTQSLFDLQERQEMLESRGAPGNVRIALRPPRRVRKRARRPGDRQGPAVTDFDYELQMAQMPAARASTRSSSDLPLPFLSSSPCEVARFGGDVGHGAETRDDRLVEMFRGERGVSVLEDQPRGSRRPCSSISRGSSRMRGSSPCRRRSLLNRDEFGDPRRSDRRLPEAFEARGC